MYSLSYFLFIYISGYTGTGGARDTTLTAYEEEQLVGYIKFMALSGCPVSKSMLQLMATDIARKANRVTRWDAGKEATDGWARCFPQRHPELKTARLVTLEDSRAKVTRDQVWYIINLYMPY